MSVNRYSPGGATQSATQSNRRDHYIMKNNTHELICCISGSDMSIWVSYAERLIPGWTTRGVAGIDGK